MERTPFSGGTAVTVCLWGASLLMTYLLPVRIPSMAKGWMQVVTPLTPRPVADSASMDLTAVQYLQVNDQDTEIR